MESRRFRERIEHERAAGPGCMEEAWLRKGGWQGAAAKAPAAAAAAAANDDSAFQSKHMERLALDINPEAPDGGFPSFFRCNSGVPSVQVKNL